MDHNNYSVVTKSELIKTFSDIDDKINNLHVRSSADFLQLNDYLKDYYNKTNIVSGNAFRILETIAGKKDINLIEELETIHQRLIDCRVKIKEDDFNRIQILKNLTITSNQLTIALRNLRQDLTTFKFLITNYNLISNYGKSEVMSKSGMEKCDIEMQSLHSSLATIGTQVDRFKEQIIYNIDHLELKVEKSLKIFHNLSKDTKSNIDLVLLKNQESKLHFPVLKEKTTNSSKSINNIITHLQYHDIIRQKIEHIQLSHTAIINELNQTITRKNEGKNNISEDFQKIGDIAGLQAAQLLMVSKEYQNALEIITKNFQGIANDLTTISNISTEFSYKDSNSEITLLKQIRNQLDEGIILLDLNHFRGMNVEYLSARKKLDRIALTLKSEISEPLKMLTEFEELNKTKSAEEASKPSVQNQIYSLAKEINSKNADICQKIDEMKLLSENLYTADNLDNWGSQLEQDRIKLMVNISRILDALDKDNEELDNVLIQNRDLNNYILEKIENAINKVDYYDYFESIVEEVISRLNGINQRFRQDLGVESVEAKAENLKEIKTTYTMDSERKVHDNVVSGIEGSDTPANPKPGEDIEFF